MRSLISKFWPQEVAEVIKVMYSIFRIEIRKLLKIHHYALDGNSLIPLAQRTEFI